MKASDIAYIPLVTLTHIAAEIDRRALTNRVPAFVESARQGLFSRAISSSVQNFSDSSGKPILKGREWFVPFAPIVLKEEAHKFWQGPSDYLHMTFAVRASDYAKKAVPAVVHIDGTMRPQVVSRDTNPWLYGVLKEFHKRTGVGVLVNTSFNRHGLPIVGSPRDAIDHLINGWVDGLSIGPWYVEVRKQRDSKTTAQ